MRTVTISERLVCAFDVRDFARKGNKSLTELARALDIGVSNFHNWHSQMTGQVPLSVAKALMVTYLPGHLAEFEAAIDGTIERRHRTCFISDETARLARDYDRERAGARIAMTNGETYIVPPQLDEPAPADDASIAGHIPAAEPEPTPLDLTIPPEVETALVLPPAPPSPRRYQIQTAAGVVEITLPESSDVTIGEREIMTAMVLRLNVQLTEAHRQNHELQILHRSAEAQASSLRGRVKELVDERAQIIETARTTAAKGVVTVHSATKPVIAKDSDFERVKATVRQIPELEKLVMQMQAEVKVHSGGSTVGFTPGAASAASLQ